MQEEVTMEMDTVGSETKTKDDIHDDIKAEESSCCSSNKSCRQAYKNLLGLSLSFFIIFGVYLSEIGLQSSINEDAGLGLATLCIIYFTFVLSCFYSASIVGIFGTKHTTLTAYMGMTVYTISNFYPSWYTLVPGSVILGLILGPLWTSHGVHITSIAHQYASAVNYKIEQVVFLFFGIYVFCLKIAYLPGNILSSSILLNGRSPNTSIVDDSLGSVCNNTEAANLEDVYLYIVLSIFVVLDIVAIVIFSLTVDYIKTDTQLLSVTHVLKYHVKQPIINTLKMVLDWKMDIVFFMMILDGFTISLVLGIFSKVYISDCIGVFWVGFCQISFGIGSAVSALLNGYLVKIVPQYVIVYFAAFLHFGNLVFLLVWQRRPSYYVNFIVLLVWGYSEGQWNAIPPSLVGSMNHKDKVAAHSFCRMGMASGFVIGFLCSLAFDVAVLLWISLAMLLAMLISYTVLLVFTQTKHELLPCCFKKSINPSTKQL